MAQKRSAQKGHTWFENGFLMDPAVAWKLKLQNHHVFSLETVFVLLVSLVK